jgi:hypothetical protein
VPDQHASLWRCLMSRRETQDGPGRTSSQTSKTQEPRTGEFEITRRDRDEHMFRAQDVTKTACSRAILYARPKRLASTGI